MRNSAFNWSSLNSFLFAWAQSDLINSSKFERTSIHYPPSQERNQHQVRRCVHGLQWSDKPSLAYLHINAPGNNITKKLIAYMSRRQNRWQSCRTHCRLHKGFHSERAHCTLEHRLFHTLKYLGGGGVKEARMNACGIGWRETRGALQMRIWHRMWSVGPGPCMIKIPIYLRCSSKTSMKTRKMYYHMSLDSKQMHWPVYCFTPIHELLK